MDELDAGEELDGHREDSLKKVFVKKLKISFECLLLGVYVFYVLQKFHVFIGFMFFKSFHVYQAFLEIQLCQVIFGCKRISESNCE